VIWKNGQSWVGIKSHIDHVQPEAYDPECAALARALETAVRRQTTPERITIFTDSQTAIRRMASDELGPGRVRALQAREHIALLHRGRPDIPIEIRWCPVHKGVAGNWKADEWAKLAAEEPDARGVEAHAMPLPRSLARLKRENSEKRLAEAKQWAGGRASRKKHKMPCRQKPDGTVARRSKWLASRFCQLKTGHCLTGQYLHWTKNQPAQQKISWAEVREESGRAKSWFEIRDLLADGRCSQVVLDFLSTTDMGRLVPAGENPESEVSEERRVRRRIRVPWSRVPGGTTTVLARILLHGTCRRGVWDGLPFRLSFLL